MKYALVQDKKSTAFKGGRGKCQCCQSEMIAHCGEFMVHHWKHKSKLECDPWWENETEWHRKWKDHFPKDWQEVIHHDQSGEKHIADIKTDQGWIIEVQHSHISHEEINSRNDFYRKIIWIIDGFRLRTDYKKFYSSLIKAKHFQVKDIIIACIDSPEESKLIRNWNRHSVPVFIDFHIDNKLWLILPTNTQDIAYVAEFKKDIFIQIANKNSAQFYNIINFLLNSIRVYHLQKSGQLKYLRVPLRTFRRGRRGPRL
ncbi:MAG: hypothetical protein CMP59_10200 [Flavobacteriales bacterium]|nr:hypothetical protein [Flavobacteriales bacterium]|tara:strand:- start:902 stop:1672 length:771 start_codon:yes stop_codon:yes gene_type:complete